MIELLNDFLSLFANRYDAYYVQVPNERRYQARWQTLATRQMINHAGGKETLALPALSHDGLAKWLAWDSDHDNGSLQRIQDFLTGEGWSVLRESKREGREGHLWMLLDEPIEGEAARRFNEEILRRVKVENSEIECLPKQTETDKLASSLRLPLGINMKRDVWKRGWFEGPSENMEEQLNWLMQQPLNSTKRIRSIYQQLKRQDELRAAATFRTVGILARKWTNEKVDLLKIIPAGKLKRQGSEFVTQCSVCALEGHDKNEDNLHIDSSDGTLFCCWWGNNPGKIHTARMILDAFGV